MPQRRYLVDFYFHDHFGCIDGGHRWTRSVHPSHDCPSLGLGSWAEWRHLPRAVTLDLLHHRREDDGWAPSCRVRDKLFT